MGQDKIKTLSQQAISFFQQGALDKAEALALKVLDDTPDSAEINYLLGLIAGRHGKYADACQRIAIAIRNNPAEPAYYMAQGLALHRAGRLEDSLSVYEQAIKLSPDNSEARYNCGVLLNELGRLEAALDAFDGAIRIKPELAVVLGSLGNQYQEQGMLDQAISCYRRNLEISPDAAAHYNLGSVFQEQGRYDEAIDSYQQALALNPDAAGAHSNLGSVFHEQGELQQAIASYRKAISLKPDLAAAHNNLGSIFQEQSKYDQALDCYKRALILQPDYADAHYNTGEVLLHQGKTNEAIECFHAALRSSPSFAAARWETCLALPVLYDSVEQIALVRNRWTSGVHELLNAVDLQSSEGIEGAKKAAGLITNFYLNYQGLNDIEEQRLYGTLLSRVANAAYPEYTNSSGVRRSSAGEKIQVGFVSSFFYNHSIFKTHGHWVTRLNRQDFHVTVFHAGNIHDWATEEIKNGVDKFFSIRNVDELIQTIAAQHLDVLIYTDLGMEPRLQLASALRLAPIQCNGGGHPVTSGLPVIDYFLGSDLMEPEDGGGHYSEELVRLPNLASSYPYPHVEKAQTPGGVQRVPDKIVYFNLQSLFKLLPQHDCLYPEIAKLVPGSQFWFICDMSEHVTEQFWERLDVAFKKHALEARDYCVMQPRVSQYEFFGLIQLADIILDGVTWSGNNSSLEALAFDKPIVTVPGSMFRDRHSAAILERIGVTDTIAGDLADYVKLAVKLGLDTDFRHSVSDRVKERKSLAYEDSAVIKGLEEFLRRSVSQLDE